MQTTTNTCLPGIELPPNVKRIKVAIPSWFASTLKRSASGKQVSFKLTSGERKCWRKKKKILPSDWAASHRIVHNSSLPGRWHNEVTPYIQGIMNASFMPSVQHIVICKTPQTGGSEGLLNCLGYIISRQPGPTMLVYPDELMARENARDRLLPMLETSRELRQYFTGKADDTSSLRINLLTMSLHMAWSGSASRLGNKPIRYVVREEIDKWQNPKGEANSLALAEARTTTWGARRKLWDICTPTTESGAIWQGLNACQAIFDYWVVCPCCGASQLMSFEQIKWPHTEQAGQEQALEVSAVSLPSFSEQHLAWYECEHCKAQWDDVTRNKAVRMGHWQERTSGLALEVHIKKYEPKSIGFHIPAWISRFVSLADVGASFKRWQKSKNLDDLKDFKNRFCAEPWVDYQIARSEDKILALCDDRPRGIVPGPYVAPHTNSLEIGPEAGHPRVAALLAGVDTQGTYLRYVIRAFGWGEEMPSWLVQCGALDSMQALERILFQTQFQDVAGNPYQVMLTVQDAMGHHAYEVYELAARYRGLILPYQGTGRASAPIILSPREYFPGSKLKIPGGVNLLRCDVPYFSSQLSAKLSIAPGDPGAYLLHHPNDPVSGSPLLDEYAAEMCAEYYDDEKQKWVCPKGKANHYWDCEKMCLVAAHHLDIRNWIPPWAARPVQVKKRKPRPERNSSRWG